MLRKWSFHLLLPWALSPPSWLGRWKIFLKIANRIIERKEFWNKLNGSWHFFTLQTDIRSVSNSNGLYNWCFQEAVLQEDFHWQRKMPMVVQMKIVWRVKGESCRQYQCGQTVSNNRMVRHVHYWRHVTLIPESKKTFSNAIDGSPSPVHLTGVDGFKISGR